MLTEVKSWANALLLSDYNYDTIQIDVFKDHIDDFIKAGLPVTLDSRFRLKFFQGITICTPNEPEVEHAVGFDLSENESRLHEAGEILLEQTQGAAVLITRGSKGMVLFERGKAPIKIPIHGNTDIVDVTGAGDTVISVLTLSLTCGASFYQAALLANIAGGIVVMKKGTATLTQEELKEAIV